MDSKNNREEEYRRILELMLRVPHAASTDVWFVSLLNDNDDGDTDESFSNNVVNITAHLNYQNQVCV